MFVVMTGAISGQAFASLYSRSDAGATNSPGQIDVLNQLATDSTLGPVSTSAEASGDPGTGSSAASYADYGVLKVSGGSSANGGPTSHISRSSASGAQAYWTDVLNINSTIGLTGAAVLHAQVIVSGDFFLDASSGPPAYPGFYISSNHGNVQILGNTSILSAVHSGEIRNDGGISQTTDYVNGQLSPIFGTFLLNIPFTFGSNLSLSGRLSGSTSTWAQGFASTNAAFNLDKSLYWGGVSSVTVEGSEVPFTLTSASGHDWLLSSAPVPEPETYAMLLTGLGLVGAIARRRKQVD